MVYQIALIEDDPVFRHRFEAIIGAAPDMNLLGSATNFREGEALLVGAAADVLLVDLGLPDGSGIDLIRRAATCWPECDMMVVTVFGDERNVMAALSAGATGYLLKDANETVLAEQIRSLRQGGSPISPVIARQLLKQFVPAQTSLPSQNRPPLKDKSDSDDMLSAREHTVLILASKGYSFKEIAKRMDISDHTVKTYIKRIYQKLQVNSKREALDEARRRGIVKD